MQATPSTGPDLVICGAARSGTSYLASLLSQHPSIDPGAVKESNYFSANLDRGDTWYDDLFEDREDGILRLDASMSYTYVQYPEALATLAAASPAAVMIYSVRDPLERLFSHYSLSHDYFQREQAQTLGAALAGRDVYAGASRYNLWLERLQESFPVERIVVVPFDAVTTHTREVVDQLCGVLGIDPSAIDVESQHAQRHRNEVVEFRHELVRRARKLVRRQGWYPTVRRTVGSDRLRHVRSLLTRPVQREELSDALQTCDDAQLNELATLDEQARAAVSDWLADQDRRLGVDWSSVWTSAGLPAGARAVAAARARRPSIAD